MRKGFTLIELLIVVAIIAILAAIAVPNFLEAQTRSKISRVKADMRSVATGLEAYLVDNQRYPRPFFNGGLTFWLGNFSELTTPVAYLTSVGFADPFLPKTESHPDDPPPNNVRTLRMFSYDHNAWWGPDVDLYFRKAYTLSSYGPDQDDDYAEWVPVRFWNGAPWPTDWGNLLQRIYDATNGTKSSGDIIRVGGEAASPVSS
jgi:prepilin-type N-terminal cleavage/methylation domain-containing protein